MRATADCSDCREASRAGRSARRLRSGGGAREGNAGDVGAASDALLMDATLGMAAAEDVSVEDDEWDSVSSASTDEVVDGSDGETDDERGGTADTDGEEETLIAVGQRDARPETKTETGRGRARGARRGLLESESSSSAGSIQHGSG